jgi:hypothetical protein
VLWLAAYDLSPIVSSSQATFLTKPSVQPTVVTIGSGLIGSVRNIQLFSKFLTQAELLVAPFTYLHPYPDLQLMVTLQSLQTSDTMDCACNRTAISDSQPVQLFDNDALKFCFPYNDYPLTKSDTSNYTFEVFPSL